jgi:crossover junction endodeoxyribonuclease RuvC
VSGTFFMGIDPGLKGGIAVLSPDGVIIEPMPTIEDTILNLPELARILRDWAPEIRMCVLEKVGAMPKQGVSSMFKFGRVYGNVEAMLIAFGIPTMLVRPQEWQKEIHRGADGNLDSKAKSYVIFSRLFPGVNALRTKRSTKPHEGMVEALLMAEFARRRNK